LWIRKLIGKYGKRDILSCLDNLQNTRTVLLGESIIDEYIYCDALGKVSKDPILAFQTKESFRHTGGVLAAAKHFAGLGSQSLIFSEVGPKDLDFVNKKLESYHNLRYELNSEFCSITKTRFVDRASGSRVFETYNLPQNYNNDGFLQKILRFLDSPNLENYNFVVMDYGHGLISDDMVKVLLDSKLNLSVNTQSNAGNRGFNSIARYAGAKKAFLNGGEVQLEARNKHAELSVVVVDLARRLEFSEIYVTNGAAGIIAYSHEMGSFSMPAFAATIIDRVGAGDATLAVISALRSASVPIEMSLFYGNIAGALLVSSIGNEFSISKDYLLGKAEEILRKVR